MTLVGKRSKNALLVLARVVTVLLPIAISVIWARSIWTRDQISFFRYAPYPNQPYYVSDTYMFEWYGGWLCVRFQRHISMPPIRPATHYWRWTSNERYFGDKTQRIGAHRFWSRYGFDVWYRRDFTWGIVLPCWALLLVSTLLILPNGIKIWQFSRSKRRQTHARCGLCGYDLRGSKDRCPECGAPIPHLGKADQSEAPA